MSKLPFLPAIFAASLALTGCVEDLTGSDDDQVDARDNLSDIELAKDFTRSFNEVAVAMEEMEQPIIDAAEQFSSDVEDINEDAVEASLVSLTMSMALAVSLIEDAANQNDQDEVTSIDYSQIAASTSFTDLLANACEEECSDEFTITSTGSVTRSGNVLSMENVEVTTELFDDETLENESIGTFTSTVSFNIELPEEDLGGDNTLGLAITGLSLDSADTSFELSMTDLGASFQLGNAEVMNLNDLLEEEECNDEFEICEPESDNEFDPTAMNMQLEGVVLKLGGAQFDGSMSMAIPTIFESDTEESLEVNTSISGKLTNSLGESILASMYMGIKGTNTQEGEVLNEESDLELDLELTFESQNHGDLSILFTSLSHNESDTNSVNDSYSSMADLSGDITITAGEESIKLTYSGSDTDSSDDSEQEQNSSQIRITDATYSSRDIYILIGSEYSDNGNGETTEVDSSGVYVDNVKYAETDFDEFTNTRYMAFTDGDKIELMAAD